MLTSLCVRRVAVAAVVCLGTASGSATATMTPPLAQAGAWEAFLTEEHSRLWGVYDFSDEIAFFPDWSAENEFISFVGGGNEPIWFFTTEEDYGGQNPFLGDYSASGIPE